MINFFDRLFGNKKKEVGKKETPSNEGVLTAPLSEESLKDVDIPDIVLRPPQLLVGSGQSVGKQREHNEDTLFSLVATLADGDSELTFGVFVVADGMGGHMHGEVASGVATRAMAEYLVKKMYTPLFGLSNEAQSDSLQEIMEAGVREAQQAVVRKAPGGGTTLSAALVIGEQVTVAHVGDSRIYFIHPDGRIQPVTQDHSLVRRLIDLGQVTEEEAMTHPQRNVLYRALGQVEPFKPDVNTLLMPKPGYMMMCSDGLWGVLPEAELFRIISSSPNPSIACNRLVEAANDAGGPDNITVVIVQYLA